MIEIWRASRGYTHCPGQRGISPGPQTKIPQVPTIPLGANAVAESPVGNSTNVTYNVVHIDPLTGRATLEYHHVQ